MRKKITILTLITTFVIMCSFVSVFANTIFRSFIVTKGTLETGSVEKVVDVASTSTSVEIYSETENITFNKAGDSNNVGFEIRNRTSSIIKYKYKFSFTSPYQNKNESLASSILVYYNDKFINTLANICFQNGTISEGELNLGGYLNKASANYSVTSDVITFTLARGSEESLNDSASSIPLKISLYSSTVDYSNNMYVSNLDEFKKATQDLNTGILENPTIILLDDLNINENIEIKYPFVLDLNGHALNNSSTMTFTHSGVSTIRSGRKIESNISTTGSYVMNNSDGLLYIDDLYDSSSNLVTSSISSNISATSYSQELLNEVLINNLKNISDNMLEAGSSNDILKGLGAYNPVVVVSSGLSYLKPNINVLATLKSKNETITVGDEIIPFKVRLTTDDDIYQSILDEELDYLVNLAQTNSSGSIIRTNSKDLFLPTAIKNKNASLEWSSSNVNAITNDGIINDKLDGNQTVTLYLKAKVNTSVYTDEFTIRLMAQNHQTIFEDFVAQLSPIRLEKIYDGTNSLHSYYFLPIVDPNYDVNNESYNGYDYRKAYNTPQQLLEGMAGYSWDGFSNVGFEYIRYSLISAYNFIDIDDSAIDSNSNSGVALYLDQATFQTFAQINVIAKYANDDEIYTSVVNVLVSTGFSTELNELVFNKVAQDLFNVDVLQNILDSRKEEGMIGEKGDFELDGAYNTYYITYAIPASSRGAISKITGYDKDGNVVASISGSEEFTSANALACTKYVVSLNPEYFETSDSSFGITTVLVMPTGNTTDTASRILYFNTPGVIKPDSNGFENLSVFNSVKYQVWYDLANNVTNESVDGDVREDDYTLSSDTASFSTTSNVVTNHTKAYILRHDASLCKTLVFSNAESVTSTDNHEVYGLSKIIDFIISDNEATFGSLYTGDISFDSSFVTNHSSVLSNGKNYITSNEKALLKDYYLAYIKNDSSAFESLFSEITNVVKDDNGIAKKLLINGSEFTASVNNYYNNTSTYGVNRNDSSYSKFLEVLQWAHNDKDSNADGMYVTGEPPCFGVIGSANWTKLSNTAYTTWTVQNYYGKDSWTSSKYAQNVNDYLEDETSYITDAELEIILVMLLNSKTRNTTGPSTSIKSMIQGWRDTYFVIPTYFNDDGIIRLISQAYTDLEKSASGNEESGFKAEMTSFTVMGDSFTTPHITLTDGSTQGFDYFTNLETLYLIGEYSKLKTFHLTNSLSNFFNRLTSNNVKIKNLAMEYASDTNIEFKIDNIANLKDLGKIDLYHNQGITNIGHLLKVDYSKIGYVDVADINVENTYSEFTLEALQYKANLIIYYTNDSTGNKELFVTALDEEAEGLIYINEFDELIAENANLVQVIYTGGGEQEVKWSIEKGNSITYVDESSTIPVLNPYANYFLATTVFSYNNMSFTPGHIYSIYLDGNDIKYDDVGLDIIIGNIPDKLSPDEINQYSSSTTISDIDGEQHIEINGFYSNLLSYSAQDYRETAAPGSQAVLQNSRTATQATIQNRDGSTETVNIYGFGYTNNSWATRQAITTTTYSTYHNSISFNVSRYYAVLENGIYTIKNVTYEYNAYESEIIHTIEDIDNESVLNMYYASRVNGSGNYYYYFSYVNLFNAFPNARYISFNGTTYDLLKDGTYQTEHVSSDSSDENRQGSTINRIGSTVDIVSASFINADVAANVETIVENKYYRVTTAKTYKGVGSDYTIAVGTYEVGVSPDGGFTYTNAASLATSLRKAYTMEAILAEANLNIDTNSYGLYYHHYYAYDGENITIKGHIYTKNNIYYLDEVNGEFVFVQSSKANEKYFTLLTGDYTSVVNAVSTFTEADVGKIYYYTGSSDAGMTQGSDVWYHVLQNEETGAYELIKFGELSSEFDIVSSETGNYSKLVPSQNSSGFKTVCNIVKYMDDANNQSTYTYGVGGERVGILKATITVGGIDYSRLFLVKVVG